jgi:hypothetical protein
VKYLILLALYKFQLVIDAISNKITVLIEEYNQEMHYQNHRQEWINKFNALPDPDPELERLFDNTHGRNILPESDPNLEQFFYKHSNINTLPDPEPGLEDFFDINDKSARQDYEAFVAAMKGHIV